MSGGGRLSGKDLDQDAKDKVQDNVRDLIDKK